MSVLTDLIYGGSHAVAGLTEGAVNDAIAKYGADHPIAFPDTAYFFPTIYAATGVKVKTLGDLPACVGVLKSLITDQEDLQDGVRVLPVHIFLESEQDERIVYLDVSKADQFPAPGARVRLNCFGRHIKEAVPA